LRTVTKSRGPAGTFDIILVALLIPSGSIVYTLGTIAVNRVCGPVNRSGRDA